MIPRIRIFRQKKKTQRKYLGLKVGSHLDQSYTVARNRGKLSIPRHTDFPF